jgi:hypothetical protein
MRPRKITAEQERLIAERHLHYVRLRVEAAKHSPPALAREFGVHVDTVRAYLERRPLV